MKGEMDIFFGLRFAVIIILVLTLGASVLFATSATSIFSPMILFLLPLSLDYYSHNPINEKNIKRKTIGIWSPVFASALIVFILCAQAQINMDFLAKYLIIKVLLWAPFLYYVLLSGADWTAYSNPDEKEYRERVQRIMRSQVFDDAKKRVKEIGKEKQRNLSTNGEY